LSKREIFVFGSNEAGRHGKGAALFAKQRHGAIYGQGRGLQGNSYAIPTKDYNLRTRPLNMIAFDVCEFLRFAVANQGMIFNVTPIGCGLAGYKHHEMAPLFKDVLNYPDLFGNVKLPNEWSDILGGVSE
jgi:hypothetical protein